jgi:hypothetical protein
MNKKVIEAINTLKVFLGMEVKLEQMKLDDGVTVLEADVFEPNQPVFIVNEEDRIELPIGEYNLEDGNVLKVVEDGIISEIAPKQEEVEEPENEPMQEEEVEMEKEVKAPVKKTVESTVKETYFSKQDVEVLNKKIEELEAKVLELSKVEEVELSEKEIKPINFNPENKQEVELHKIGSGKNRITSILEQVYKHN